MAVTLEQANILIREYSMDQGVFQQALDSMRRCVHTVYTAVEGCGAVCGVVHTGLCVVVCTGCAVCSGLYRVRCV